MKKDRNRKKKEAIKEWLREHGYTEDRYGNWLKQTKNGTYRYKFNDISLRREAKGEANGEWIRLWSAFYRDIEIEEVAGDTGLRTSRVIK